MDHQSISPMLAKAIDKVPEPDSVPGGLGYEPKWDGFRAIISFDGTTIEIGSRGSKMLTRYFPELTEALPRLFKEPCVLDGEIVVAQGGTGSARLDWEALSQRIHPAASRIKTLSQSTPAMFVAFDLLVRGETDLQSEPFEERRKQLVEVAGGHGDPLYLSQLTTDVALARQWLVEFEGAGLDGVVAKPLAAAYAPGKRTMLKIKHHRTADVVLLGYRIHKSGSGVGSLLLGLYDAEGVLQNVGGASAFSDARRLSLIEELEPLVLRDDDGEIVVAERERNRFSSGKDVSYVPLDPSVVAEVRYDQMEGSRFRHTVQIARFRPDRDAKSCTFEQLEVPVAYDLSTVLS
jgi:ATP-dependent DNA ligase